MSKTDEACKKYAAHRAQAEDAAKSKIANKHNSLPTLARLKTPRCPYPALHTKSAKKGERKTKTTGVKV